MKRGRLIVIEGSDGAGKTTQLNLLKEYLVSESIPVQTIDFPRYYDSFYGKMVAQFLRGEFGKLKDVDPHLASVLYALDRGQAKEEMNNWLDKGNVVLSNRYATSNIAHQSARMTPKKREEFIKWDTELEYEVNGIPKEDLVIYLYVPYKVSRKLMRNADRKNRSYTKGKKDITEKDLDYLKKSEQSYLRLVNTYPHWIKIICVDKKGNLKTREAIHEELKKVLINKEII
jgi:dTMP kinase